MNETENCNTLEDELVAMTKRATIAERRVVELIEEADIQLENVNHAAEMRDFWKTETFRLQSDLYTLNDRMVVVGMRMFKAEVVCDAAVHHLAKFWADEGSIHHGPVQALSTAVDQWLATKDVSHDPEPV